MGKSGKKKQPVFSTIVNILKRYVDMEEKYYTIVSLWIIGTYFHDDFRTFPYLYINASKGSGKTRLLKLIAYLSKEGKVLGLPTEAFIFRSTGKMTFCLDEMEYIERKESHALRLLLNSSYKRGMFIPRIKKTKTGEMTPEEFEAFAPICIANIWGMGDVLQDRCITIVLERSKNPIIMRKIEAWEFDDDVIHLKNVIKTELKECSLCSVVTINKNIEKIWNDILTTLTTLLHTQHYITQTTPSLNDDKSIFDKAFGSLDWFSGRYKIEVSKDVLRFFKCIYESGIDGRNLEIYFPLFTMSFLFGDKTFKNIIKIAKEESEKKMAEDIFENRDASLVYSLLQIPLQEQYEWVSIRTIKSNMKEVIGEEKENKDGSITMIAPKWLNSKWIGRALKRMNLNKSKKRTSSGIEVMLNIEKLDKWANVYGVDTP